jgi:hypothetical protein
MRRLLRLFPYVRQLENDLELERMRLAACGVAALGYFDGCNKEYESASLHDVLRLWEKAYPGTPQGSVRVCRCEKPTYHHVPTIEESKRGIPRCGQCGGVMRMIEMHRHGEKPGTTEKVLGVHADDRGLIDVRRAAAEDLERRRNRIA